MIRATGKRLKIHTSLISDYGVIYRITSFTSPKLPENYWNFLLA